jgi:glycosyltransferase involved in cell wall biosynthesis
MSEKRKRVLFVAYLFPPVGGVGVHRATKFVKYLPEFGWDCSVLTALNPSAPLFDESLLKNIPAETIIRRAKTYEPGYAVKSMVSASRGANARPGLKDRVLGGVKSVLRSVSNLVLQPDPQILWRPQAMREGLKLLREIPHDAIIATGPPFSSLLVGASLSRKTGVPLMLDYRDEWSISNAYWENKKQGRFANWLQTRMQQNALRAARTLLATTPSSADEVAKAARAAGSVAPSTYIYNGFDPDDFEAHDAIPPVKKNYGQGTSLYRMSFIGTLWNLNSIAPLVDAICRLAASNPELVAHLELVCAGRKTADQEAQLDRLNGLPCHVVRLPFVEHTEAVQLMRASDALLMLNTDLPETKRIINAKTFEYMAAKRPVFVVAPEGDVWDILRDLPGTVLCAPSQVESIREKLSLEIERHRCGVHHDDAHWEISRFERRNLAGQLAELLDAMTVTSSAVAQSTARI